MGWAASSISSPARRRARAVCVTLRAEASDGADGALEALLGDLADQVRAEEAGCASYVVTRSLGSRTQFAVHARFSDWAAFKDHGQTAHLERLLPQLTALLAAPVSLEIFLEV
jgi:quinol monooxygenase YgiN